MLLVVALLDQAMVNMPLVGLTYAHVRSRAPDDCRERVDDGHACYDQRDEQGGDGGGARNIEQRDDA